MQAIVPPPKYVSPPARGMWTTKLVLRAASIVLTVIIGALGGSLTSSHRGYVTTSFTIVLLPGLIPTFLWDVAEGLYILASGDHHGIHPGAIVGVDLLIWLAWIFIAVFLSYLGYVHDPMDLIIGHPVQNYATLKSVDLRLAEELLSKGRPIVALSSLLITLHFVLFVLGCYETHIRRRMAKAVPHDAPSQYHQVGQLPTAEEKGKPPPYTQTSTQPQENSTMPQQPPPYAPEMPPHVMTPPPAELPLQQPQAAHYLQHAQ